jgi:hypothetical protein
MGIYIENITIRNILGENEMNNPFNVRFMRDFIALASEYFRLKIILMKIEIEEKEKNKCTKK